MIRTFRVIPHNSPEYEELVQLRDQVLRKPLGMQFSPDELARESAEIHLGIYQDEQLAGCLILAPVGDNTLKMRQVAVAEDYQHTGVGSELVQFAEKQATQQGYRRIVLAARETAIGFYLKLGYTCFGDPFIEISLPHRMMEKWLSST